MRKRTREIRSGLAALLALAWAPALLAGKPKEVVARWEELAPLVEKREIETVLANGVHLRGRVEKVLPEALEVRVKRTSDPSLVPKGRTRVPREVVSVLTVRWRQGPARVLLSVAGPVALGAFVVFGLEVDPDTPGGSVWLSIFYSAGIVGGYALGRRLDTRSIRVVVNKTSSQEAEVSPQVSTRREDYAVWESMPL